MKYILRALPLVILPFTVNFPGAILCYWVASNFISLGQVGFLKIPKIRDYFKIEPLVTHKAENLPIQNKGFVGGIKDCKCKISLCSFDVYVINPLLLQLGKILKLPRNYKKEGNWMNCNSEEQVKDQ